MKRFTKLLNLKKQEENGMYKILLKHTHTIFDRICQKVLILVTIKNKT